MPRIRSIHPDLLQSPTMAKCTAEQERTFNRLLLLCDDWGRAIDEQPVIRNELYPAHRDVSEEQVENDLVALARLRLIIRYEVEGRHYLFVRSWFDYQHPQHPARGGSRYPEPPGEAPAPPPPPQRSGRRARATEEAEPEEGIEVGVESTPLVGTPLGWPVDRRRAGGSREASGSVTTTFETVSRTSHESLTSAPEGSGNSHEDSGEFHGGEELSRRGVGVGEGVCVSIVNNRSSPLPPGSVDAHTGHQRVAQRWKLDPDLSTHDALKEALAEVCGYDLTSLSAQERGGLNASIKRLLDVNATPSQVRLRADHYRQHFTTPLTAPALVKHWGFCANPPPPPAARPQRDPLAGIKAHMARHQGAL